MRLIVVNSENHKRTYIVATPDMTVDEILRFVKKEKWALSYKGTPLWRHNTLRDCRLRTRHKLSLHPPKKRRMRPEVRRAKAPCMITLDDADERAEMTCGHAITPDALFEMCEYAFRAGKCELRCPYVGDDMAPCDKIWSMDELIEKACLNPSEHGEFLLKITQTISNLQKVRDNISVDQELANILNSCEWKKIGSNVSCPSTRACPKCGAVIEHIMGCPNMECTFPGCGTRFCFVCLQERCRGSCYIAPIQFQVKANSVTADGGTAATHFVRRLSKRLSKRMNLDHSGKN